MALKLLTVDDSRTIRRIVTSYAKDLAPDVQIIEAANGQECIDKCKETLPDIIILDVNMPVMTGEECLQHLRASDATKTIPVVMLTTESEKQLVVRLLQMGVQQFIIKPFEKQEFLEKVGGVVAKLPKKAGAASSAPKTPEGKYVIVVEDKENIAKTIVDAAQKGKLGAVVTTEAGEAMAHLKKNGPAIVLANLTMEKTDGFDLFRQMRKVPDRQEIRYVGMCLKTAADVISRARGTGYIEVLTKPFTTDIIASVLASNAKAGLATDTNGDVFIIKGTGGKFQATIPLILKAIDGAAEEGFMKVLIDLTALEEADLSDVTLWGTIAEKTDGLGIAASYVSPSMRVVEKLKGLVDTAELKVTTDQADAINALAA